MLLFLLADCHSLPLERLQAGAPSKQPLTVIGAHRQSVMLSVTGRHVALAVDSLLGFPAGEVEVRPLQQAVPGHLWGTGSFLHLPYSLLHQA